MTRALSLSVVLCLACGSPGGADGGGGAGGGAASGGGHFYFTQGDSVFRIAAQAGATAEKLTPRLQALSPSTERDRRLTASVDGRWLVLSALRFGCASECLVRVASDFSSGEAVKPGGAEVSTEGVSAIAASGELIVYPAQGGPHPVDLFATRRGAAGWSAPVLLTGASSRAYNNMPALSFDGAQVFFDCGAQPYPESGGNDACVVGTDGSGFAVKVSPSTLPQARQSWVQNPRPALDGLLFESSWPIGAEVPETIWLLPPSGPPQPIGKTLTNAVSPCGLRDGRFGALWLTRPGNPAGAHELTLMGRDGQLETVLTPGVDVDDIGVGCSD